MRLLSLLVASLALGGTVADAATDDPFPIRNQLPFHLPFLGQTPRGAHLSKPGQTRLTFHLTHSNTLAASDELISAYRASADAGMPMEVTLASLESIAAGSPGQTAFILDGETLRAVLDFGIAVGSRLELEVEVPFLLHSSGLFDSPIDRYHEFLGLPDGGRPAFVEDRFVAGYVGDGETVYFGRPPGGIGLGDVVLGARTALARGAGRGPAVAASLHLKLPTGEPERLEGSGSVDFGAGVQISHRFGRSTLHGGYSRSFLGDWSIAPGLELRDPQSFVGVYAFNLTSRITILGQILRSKGPFPSRPGSDLAGATTEVAIGSRHSIGASGQIEWALIEDLESDFDSPDLGFFVGVTKQFGPPQGRNPEREIHSRLLQ